MKKKGAGIYFEQYIPAELSGGRSRSSSAELPLKPDWNWIERARKPSLPMAPTVASGSVGTLARSNSELVASRGVDETPAASIGDVVGKIVQRLESLFAFDAVRH